MAEDRRKLYQSKERPDHWIGEDEHGVLMIWPARRRGWLKRTGFSGSKRQLQEVDPALARGTGWPFGPVGRRPRGGEASSTLGIRVTSSERAKWQRAADKRERGLTVWAREELDAAADRTLDEGGARPRSKSKP
jgi:hypothetical protein